MMIRDEWESKWALIVERQTSFACLYLQPFRGWLARRFNDHKVEYLKAAALRNSSNFSD